MTMTGAYGLCLLDLTMLLGSLLSLTVEWLNAPLQAIIGSLRCRFLSIYLSICSILSPKLMVFSLFFISTKNA